MAQTLLKVTGLKVGYGGIQAVKGVDFEVREGELVSLIGSNGAGKTTTMKAITGSLPLAGGDIEYLGKSIKGQGPWDLVRQGLAMVPEGRGVFTRMSITENLLMGAYIRSDKAAIAQDLAGTERAIIVGPGPGESFDQKEMQILKLLPRLKEVHFVDVNAEFNKQAARIVRNHARSSGHHIRVQSHEMDFRNAVSTLPPRPNTTVFSTGSLVSNVPNAPLDWFPNHAMGEFIGAFAKLAGDGGKVMLGYDSNNSANTLEKAYNEDLAPFIENIMRIIVDHSRGIKGLKASAGHFHYESEWLERAGQVAHKLIAEQDQKFEICFEGRTHSFFLEKGEEFIVMSSLRPSVDRLTKIAENVFMQTESLYVAESGIVDQIFTVKMPKLPQPGQP